MAGINNHGPKVQGMSAIQFTPTGARIFDGTGAPTDGTSGTGAGLAAPGSMFIRSDSSAAVYINTGTLASPTWKAITHA